jgi:hypothetical protein
MQSTWLLLSGLEAGREKEAKDAILYIHEVFGHRPPRQAPHRRLMRAEEATGGKRPPEGSPGLLRSRLTPSKPQDNVASTSGED